MSENNVNGIAGADVATTTGIVGATIGIGQYIVNDYVITIAEAEGDYGYTMTITRGTETQTVTLYGLTSEQYDAMLGYLEAAQSAAQSSASSANTAATARNAAQSARNAAQSARDDAQSASETSIQAANAAITARNSALTYANNAQTAANTANSARSGADAARSAAVSAKTAAESAATRAETAAGEITGMTAEAETLAPGSEATAYFLDGVLSLGIPAGATGPTGADGNGIVSITKTGTQGNVDTYTITMTDGSTSTFTVTNGTDGAVLSVAGKTGAVTLDAGDVEYDDTDTYAAGSVGAGLADLKSQINNLDDEVAAIQNKVGGTIVYSPTLTFVNDEYYKPAVTEKAGVARADYIPVVAGDEVTIKTTAGGALYNCYWLKSDYTLVSGITVDGTSRTHTVPTNAAYMALSNSINAVVKNVVCSIKHVIAGSMVEDIADIEGDITAIETGMSAVKAAIPAANAKPTKAPLILNMLPDFAWYSRYEIEAFSDSLPKYVDGDVAADNNAWFKITGNAGESVVTVVSGGNGDVLDITAEEKTRPFAAVIGYDDGKFYPCNAQYLTDTTFSVYPPLKENITDGELAQAKTIIHLSRRGYIAYAQHIFNAKRRHCEKSRYLARWRAEANVQTFPFTVYYAQSTKMQAINYNSNIGDNYINHLFPEHFVLDLLNDATSSNYYDGDSGIKWSVPIKGYNGYVELFLSLFGDGDYELPAEDAFTVELWVDGVKTQTVTKTSKPCERICLDFNGGDVAELRVYGSRWRYAGMGMRINNITWWVNDVFTDDKPLIPKGTTTTLLFDSWGTFDDAQTYETLQDLIDADADVSVPFVNESVGGKTSEWGRNNFFTLVTENGTKLLLVNFGVNDQGISMSDADYNKYMGSIIDFALNNDIQPVIVMVPLYNYQRKGYQMIDALATEIT